MKTTIMATLSILLVSMLLAYVGAFLSLALQPPHIALNTSQWHCSDYVKVRKSRMTGKTPLSRLVEVCVEYKRKLK